MRDNDNARLSINSNPCTPWYPRRPACRLSTRKRNYMRSPPLTRTAHNRTYRQRRTPFTPFQLLHDADAYLCKYVDKKDNVIVSRVPVLVLDHRQPPSRQLPSLRVHSQGRARSI